MISLRSALGFRVSCLFTKSYRLLQSVTAWISMIVAASGSCTACHCLPGASRPAHPLAGMGLPGQDAHPHGSSSYAGILTANTIWEPTPLPTRFSTASSSGSRPRLHRGREPHTLLPRGPA